MRRTITRIPAKYRSGKVLATVATVIIGAIIVIALILLPTRDKPMPEAKETAVNVSVIEVAPIERLEDRFVLKGDVEPWTTLRLSAETAGRVSKITVSEGDPVTPGAPLVYLDDDLLTASATQARTKAEFDTRELKRMTDAGSGGVATEMEMDQARSNAASSAAARDLAEAQLRHTVIKAPNHVHNTVCGPDQVGRVNDLPVEVGEYVQPGQMVAELLETRCLRVVVHVPELDIRYIRVGQDAEVTVEALGDRKITGKIHYIESIANPSTRTFRTEIMVPNEDGQIRPGMFVRVGMLRRVIENAIMIPFDAAAPMERDYEIYVSRDGKAIRRTIGFDQTVIHGKLMLVTDPVVGEGLHSGDKLIIQGQRLLGDGQLIAEQMAPKRMLAELGLLPDQPVAATSRPAEQE